jgi:hypothetical protein
MMYCGNALKRQELAKDSVNWGVEKDPLSSAIFEAVGVLYLMVIGFIMTFILFGAFG